MAVRACDEGDAGAVVPPKETVSTPPKPEAAAAPRPEALEDLASFRECPVCPEMIVIPDGVFMMGSPEIEPKRGGSEGPHHPVAVPRFAVGKFEVTFEEWDACVLARACSHLPEDRGWGRGRRPVIYVSWEDAQEYVGWLSEQTGADYRLLSEAEWEYVARAGTRTPFHTGARISSDQANFNGNGTYNGSSRGEYRRQTVEVGGFAPNAWGLHDVHGNVWEWVQDCWHGSYDGAPIDGSALDGGWRGECSRAVVRGGSWGDVPHYLRSAFRDWVNRDDRSTATRVFASPGRFRPVRGGSVLTAFPLTALPLTSRVAAALVWATRELRGSEGVAPRLAGHDPPNCSR